MSSVRRLKQKGMSLTGTPRFISPADNLTVGNSTDYDYRKAAFAFTPPATTVRPMRVVRSRVTAALEAMQRALAFASKAGMTFDQARAVTAPQRAQVQTTLSAYKRARRAAVAGQGRIVHGYAA